MAIHLLRQRLFCAVFSQESVLLQPLPFLVRRMRDVEAIILEKVEQHPTITPNFKNRIPKILFVGSNIIAGFSYNVSIVSLKTAESDENYTC